MIVKKWMALAIALCLALSAVVGAAAEEPDVIGDLLSAFLGGAPAEEQPAEEQPAEEQPAEEQPAEEQPAEEASAEAYPQIDESYVYDAWDQEDEIVVDELIQVDDYAITEGLPEDWQNILLLGTDNRGTSKYSRTDTMIILSVNAKTGEAKLSSIMRDTWVSLPGHSGAKLNAACVYGGPQLTMRTINEYFDLNIEYYVLVNMRCLVDIVEALGGIRIDVSEAERKAMNALITSDAESEDAGDRAFATSLVSSSGPSVLLNGKQALAYARIRKSDSDYARTERQRKVLVTIAKQLQQENVFALAGIITNLLQYVETNLTFDEIMNLAAVGMQLNVDGMPQLRIPADGTYTSGMLGDVWCIQPNFEENAKILRAFIYGE